jgi:CubicO group peptidase (beta-lactamase class C family)
VRTAFFFALMAAACAQDPQRIDRIAQHYHDRDQFMGTVVVARGDQIIFEKSYGYANMEWQVPFAPDTRFRIASLSKQFTAAAILLLQEDGKLKTSDPLSKYYKSAPASWRNITLRNLLTQTSGIPNYTALAPPNFNRLPILPMNSYIWSRVSRWSLTLAANSITPIRITFCSDPSSNK